MAREETKSVMNTILTVAGAMVLSITFIITWVLVQSWITMNS